MARRVFQRSVEKKKTWMTKGWGTEEKQEKFRAWARRKIDKDSEKVYVFWNGKKCSYVGRTRGRGSSDFDTLIWPTNDHLIWPTS
jgi:hypothetical protein